MTTFSGPLNVKPWLVEGKTTYIEGSGTTVIHEDLHVSATAIFYDQVDFRDGVLIDTLLAQVVNTSGLNVSATTRFGSQTSFAGEILVSGSAFFYEGARFSASTRFLGPVSFSSGIISSGNGTFAENVSVSAVLFLNALDVSGSARIHGNLDVSASAFFSRRVTIGNPTSAAGLGYGLEVLASSRFLGVIEAFRTAAFLVSGGGSPVNFPIKSLVQADFGVGGSSSALTAFTAIPYTSTVTGTFWANPIRTGIKFEAQQVGATYHAGMYWGLDNVLYNGQPAIGIFGKSEPAGTSLYFGASNYTPWGGLDVLFTMDHYGNFIAPGGISVGAPVTEVPTETSADRIYSSSVFYGPVTFLGGTTGITNSSISASGSSVFYGGVTFGPSGRVLLSGGATVSASSVFHDKVTINGGSAIVRLSATIVSNNTAGNPVSFAMLPNSSLIEAYVDTVVPWSDLTGTRIKIGVSGSAMFFSNVAVSGTTATGIRQRASDSRTGTLKRWNNFSSQSGDATGVIKVFASAFLGTSTGETIVTFEYTN